MNALRSQNGLPSSRNASFFEKEEATLDGLHFTWNNREVRTKVYIYTRVEQEDKHELGGDPFRSGLPYHVPLQMCLDCCKRGDEVPASAVLSEVKKNKEKECEEMATMIDLQCCYCEGRPSVASSTRSK